MTRKAQAVAERQARLRALREQYNREERHLMQDQQDLQQSARVIAIQSEAQSPVVCITRTRMEKEEREREKKGSVVLRRDYTEQFTLQLLSRRRCDTSCIEHCFL